MILGILGLGVLIRVAPENYWERMGTIASSAEQGEAVDQSSETRLELLSAQWKMFLAYPLGSGHRGTAYLSPRYLSEESLARSRKDPFGQRARSSHNTFMTALVEQGIPGGILFLSLLVWIMRTSFSTRARLQAAGNEQLELYLMAASGSLGTVVAAGMFTDYLKAEVFIWALALLAVLATLPLPFSAAAAVEGPADSHASLGRRLGRSTIVHSRYPYVSSS